MSKPEWVEIAPGIHWCKGCGVLRTKRPTSFKGKHKYKYTYKVPHREADRRRQKRGDIANQCIMQQYSSLLDKARCDLG